MTNGQCLFVCFICAATGYVVGMIDCYRMAKKALSAGAKHGE